MKNFRKQPAGNFVPLDNEGYPRERINSLGALQVPISKDNVFLHGWTEKGTFKHNQGFMLNTSANYVTGQTATIFNFRTNFKYMLINTILLKTNNPAERILVDVFLTINGKNPLSSQNFTNSTIGLHDTFPYTNDFPIYTEIYVEPNSNISLTFKASLASTAGLLEFFMAGNLYSLSNEAGN